MQQVIIVIHLMVVTALVVVVLYQKSEGGALGMGGQSGLFSGRGQANALTRATSILATIFFMTSIALTVLPAWERRAKGGEDWTTAVEQNKLDLKEVPAQGAAKEQPAGDGKESIFDQLRKAQEQRQKATPSATAPVAPAPAAPDASAVAPAQPAAPAATPSAPPALATPAAPAPTTAPPAPEAQMPALRPTQEPAPASAPALTEPAPAPIPAPAPAPPTIWKSPTQ